MGIEEIKDLVLPALLTKLIATSVSPLLELLQRHTNEPELILETLAQATRLRTSIKTP